MLSEKSKFQTYFMILFIWHAVEETNLRAELSTGNGVTKINDYHGLQVDGWSEYYEKALWRNVLRWW
jgi:hypothetical protein